jgi:hypothetical protein
VDGPAVTIRSSHLAQDTGIPQGPPSATGTPLAEAPVQPMERPFDTRPVGHLVGRPDLSEETVLKAIAERLAFDGRTGPEPQVVIEAARLGKRKALAFLRKLVLPPPRGSLTMPVQPILREHLTQGTDGSH